MSVRWSPWQCARPCSERSGAKFDSAVPQGDELVGAADASCPPADADAVASAALESALFAGSNASDLGAVLDAVPYIPAAACELGVRDEEPASGSLPIGALAMEHDCLATDGAAAQDIAARERSGGDAERSGGLPGSQVAAVGP